MSSLLPCPFCSSSDVVSDSGSYGNWYVICNECGAEKRDLPSQNEAALKWNARPDPRSPAHVTALAEAMWQLLDDMSTNGLCVCALAKAEARIAYEPFREGDEYHDWMSMAEAQAVIDSAR